MSELPFREAGDVETLIHGARKEGAAGVEDIGQLLAGLGTSELGTGSAGANAGASRLESERVAQSQLQQQQQMQAGMAVGQMIASILTAGG